MVMGMVMAMVMVTMAARDRRFVRGAGAHQLLLAASC
jgi:hypothetical protein